MIDKDLLNEMPMVDDTPVEYEEEKLSDDTPLDAEDDQEGIAEFRERVGFPPPADGPTVVYLTLMDPTDEKPHLPVYSKGEGKERSIVAGMKVRAENRDGRPGASLKDMYASTAKGPGQAVSSLGSIIYIATGQALALRGVPPSAIIEKVKDIFADAGEDGIRLLAKTTWSKSILKVDKEGEPLLDKMGKKQYKETKGQAALTLAHVKEAKKNAKEVYGEGTLEYELAVKRAIDNPWVYFDASRGEEMSVKAEVAGVLGAAPERVIEGEE